MRKKQFIVPSKLILTVEVNIDEKQKKKLNKLLNKIDKKVTLKQFSDFINNDFIIVHIGGHTIMEKISFYGMLPENIPRMFEHEVEIRG